MRNFAIIFLIFILGIFIPSPILALEAKDEFPKLAGLYLNPIIAEANHGNLAKYDLLVLDVDAPNNNPLLLNNLKEKKLDKKILAYIPSQSVNDQDLGYWALFRQKTYDKVVEDNWWLRGSNGEIINFSNIWPTIKFVDVSNGWSDYLSSLSSRRVIDNLWDGIFYDMVFADVSGFNGGDIDINKDGVKDDKNYVNKKWQEGMAGLFKETREKLGNGKIILINGDSLDLYQPDINGRIFETFPTPWEGDGSWQAVMKQYLEKLPQKNISPQIYILNSNTNNTGKMDSYKKMRFGLTSTLLGDGYFSFDHGDQSHAQTWWYDEYDVNLGKAESRAYNLFDRTSSEIKQGFWRRDFDFGVALVNSTNETQKYIFNKEEFEKINGVQDRRVNDGSKINWIKLEAGEGAVLLKTVAEVVGQSFDNGAFMRVFDKQGKQARNGFFAYKDSFPGDTQILQVDLENDGDLETLASGKGVISIYKNGKKISDFSPYNNFKGDISFTVGDLNNDGREEIITAAGKGGGPHVRIFTGDGKPLGGGFFAYDKNFRGGVSVAVGDTNGDGIKEIITAPASGGGPHVKIFNKIGKLLGQFFAYDKNMRTGIKVMANDINQDKKDEILVGSISF